jgi:hypothetical protein
MRSLNPVNIKATILSQFRLTLLTTYQQKSDLTIGFHLFLGLHIRHFSQCFSLKISVYVPRTIHTAQPPHLCHVDGSMQQFIYFKDSTLLGVTGIFNIQLHSPYVQI